MLNFNINIPLLRRLNKTQIHWKFIIYNNYGIIIMSSQAQRERDCGRSKELINAPQSFGQSGFNCQPNTHKCVCVCVW